MRSYCISHGTDRFDIRPYFESIDALAATGKALLWERGGMIGKLDNAMLREQVMIYVAYKQMQQAGRIVDLPAAAYELRWEQTIERRSSEEFTQPLRFDVVKPKGEQGNDPSVPH